MAGARRTALAPGRDRQPGARRRGPPGAGPVACSPSDRKRAPSACSSRRSPCACSGRPPRRPTASGRGRATPRGRRPGRRPSDRSERRPRRTPDPDPAVRRRTRDDGRQRPRRPKLRGPGSSMPALQGNRRGRSPAALSRRRSSGAMERGGRCCRRPGCASGSRPRSTCRPAPGCSWRLPQGLAWPPSGGVTPAPGDGPWRRVIEALLLRPAAARDAPGSDRLRLPAPDHALAARLLRWIEALGASATSAEGETDRPARARIASPVQRCAVRSPTSLGRPASPRRTAGGCS